jgi:DNA polymerase-1
MAERIFLVDGMYLLFSSFYSNRNMRTLKGEPTGAVYGFVTRIESIIRDLRPQRIAAAFDSREKTFRHQLFAPYKAKRLAPPEELLLQIPLVKEYLELRKIPLFEEPGFEADDIIAACARAEARKGNEVLVFSADKDLFQLVNDHIFIYHPKLKQKLDAAAITEHFGVSPAQVVDYLSLTGDSSDNIPGVPGVGEKTALKIISQFGSLDNLLDNLEKAGEKIKKKIQENMEKLQVSRRLIDLANAPGMEREFQLEPFNDEITPQLLDFYGKLSFNSLLKRFGDAAPSPVEKEEKPASLDISYHLVKNIDQLRELKEKIQERGYFAFDLETTDLEFYKAEIVGLSISFKTEGYYIPLLYSRADAQAHELSIGFDDVARELSGVFQDHDIKKTGHNLKFDILHLKHRGIVVNGAADDSMVMSYLIQPNRRAHNLKDLTLELLNYRQVSYDELAGKGKKQKQLITVDLDALAKYCIDDSYLTLKLKDILAGHLDKKELNGLYTTIEMPLVTVLMEMEYAGVRLDVDFLKKAAAAMEEKISAVEKEIFEMAGCRLNLNSSQQLGELLFEKMNLPVKKRTRKTKSYSTDNEVLNELKNFPIVARIIDYRTYKKLLSTYLTGLLETVDDHQRVHGSFNQTVTATGRLSSSNPNLQNIPVGEIAGINVRDAFTAEEGKRLLAADYSQIELRVMAHFSQDPNLVEAFAKDFDIHQHTADRVFGGDLFASPKEKRKRAKIINFSVLYGSGPYALSRELGVTYNEAKEFIDMYFETHAGVKAFIDKIVAEAEQEPEVKTISGRRRYIPEILSANRTVKENGKRMAINTIIQGSAADIIKIAMINIHRRLEEKRLKSKLIMQVHDELVFEYPLEEEQELLQLVKQQMEHAVELDVPLKVDLETGKTWGSLELVTTIK